MGGCHVSRGTMQPVPSDKIDLAAPLFAGLEHHLALQAILKGYVAAGVYLDDLDAPRMAFTWTQSRAFVGGSAARGDAAEQLAALLGGEVWPALWDTGDDVLVFHDAAGPWQGILAEALAPYRPERYERLYLALRRPSPSEAQLPPGYKLRIVDASLLADETLSGRDALVEEMLSERPSVEAFLRESLGVCAVHNNTVVGWCLSEYNTADRCEVGIAVAEGHRRQGIATAMTAGLVKVARERGITEIGWHCWANNVASAATARKAGFALQRRYAVYVAFCGAG